MLWLRVAIKLFRDGDESAIQGYPLVEREIRGQLGRFFNWCGYPLDEVEYFDHSSVVMANLSESEYRELLARYSRGYQVTLL